MKVLGLDTSGYANAVGVIDGEKVLADFIFEARTDSLQKIVLNIDAALKEAGLRLEDIDGIGVGLGPGSWTGIRIGVTVGKMLAYATRKPVAGITTLEVLAFSAREAGKLVCPVISAGIKDTVYSALYRSEDGSVARVGDYYVGDVKGLRHLIEGNTVLIGSAVEAYRELVRQGLIPGVAIETIEAMPRGVDVAFLAADRLGRGEVDNALSLTPLYLKESTARALARPGRPGLICW